MKTLIIKTNNKNFNWNSLFSYIIKYKNKIKIPDIVRKNKKNLDQKETILIKTNTNIVKKSNVIKNYIKELSNI